MDEHQTDQPTPPLRPQRWTPGEVEKGPRAEWPMEAVASTQASWRAAADEAPSLALTHGGHALAEHTWRLIEQMLPQLSALPALLQSVAAPQEAVEHAETLRALVLALPQHMASGLEASLAQVDGLFTRLLNAPGRAGLIAQVIDALASSSPADERRTEQEAQQERLRALHRELVTLHTAWEAVREATFLEEFPLLAIPGTANNRQEESVGPPAAAPPSAPPLQMAPLPAASVLVPPMRGKPGAGSSRRRPGRQHWQRLALGLAMLVLAGAGVLLLHGQSAPALQAKATAFSGTQRSPSPATASPLQPTSTPSAAAPTPRLPTPAPQPTLSPPDPTSPLGGWHCPPGSAFCVSTLQVDLSCSGDGGGTFQLLNASASKARWRARWTPGPDGFQGTIVPSAGNLKPANLVTLTVYASAQGQPFLGAISILGPDGTAPITVAVNGCGA